MAEQVPSEGHEGEAHEGLASRLNWLRAAVLGANDGVVSTAGIVLGVAGAAGSRAALLTAGLAGLLAGALSMAAGEYVSVSTQRDAERAALEREKRELRDDPAAELDELVEAYVAKGLSPELARQVAVELTAHDALAAHAETELRLDPEELINPWQAAFASFGSFSVGALLPLLAILLPPHDWRVPVTVVAVLAALVLCGWSSARTGGSPPRASVVRNVAGGGLAMAVTYVTGTLLHVSGV
jgi:VIT1/CCC1 family predicted Fe2+/Mn2+ transporter